MIPVLGEVAFVVEFAEMALAAVAEYCHDGVAWTELPRRLYGPHAVDAGRGACLGRRQGGGGGSLDGACTHWRKMQVSTSG